MWWPGTARSLISRRDDALARPATPSDEAEPALAGERRVDVTGVSEEDEHEDDPNEDEPHAETSGVP